MKPEVEDKEIKDLIQRTADSLRSTGVYGHSSFEYILFLFVWKFLSDKLPDKPKANEMLTFNSIRNYYFHNPPSEVTKSLNTLIQNAWGSNFYSLIDIKLDNINTHTFNNILTLWVSKFDHFENNKTDCWQSRFIGHFYSNLLEFSAEHYPEAHQYFTPKEIALLLSSLVDTKSMDSVFDPYCRSGNILFSVNEKLKSKKNAVGHARNSISYQVAKINSLMVDSTVEIEKAEHDSFVNSGDKYDIIVTNPPFGQMVFDIKGFSHSAWDSFNINRYESAFLVHGLNHLSDKGQFAIVLPQAFLSTTGKTAMLRKKLLEDNVLEAIVTLPSKVFFNTSIASCILVLNRNKKSNKVLFLNGSSLGKTENYRRVLQQDEIEGITRSLQEFRRSNAHSTIEGFSKVLSFDEIEDRGFDLNFSSTTGDSQVMPADLQPSSEILGEIKDLYKQLATVQNKIDSLLFRKDGVS